jgi:simple sugar transport system permease protein
VKLGARERALASVQALAVAWIAFVLLVWGYGEAPLAVARLLFDGTWGTPYGIGQVLFKATPLLCTGVAVDIGLEAGLFNIGGEGQLAVASLAVAVAASHMTALPSFIAIPLALLVALVAGGAWAALPALLRARFGAHEVIGTIMMNRIADALIGAAIGGGLAVAGTVRTRDIAPSAHIARLDAVIPQLKGSAASFALVLALFLAWLVAWAFRRTRVGREMALVGLSPRACEAAHIPVSRRLTLALTLSGAAAGLASSATVLGYKGYFEMGLGAGTGFAGIAVALLGRGSALGLALAALFFGTLQQGGLAINAHVPREVVEVIEGVVIVAIAVSDASVRRSLLARPREAI